jgi:hypothetical protein
MADMELLIKIPEKLYKNIQSGKFWLDSGLTLSNAYDFIKNGTPLPKGHGRLVDADALYDQFEYADYDFEKTMEYAPTIIEADKAERSDKE